MNIDYFNKLINKKENYYQNLDLIKNNIVDIFNNLEDSNLYVKKIRYIWDTYKKNSNYIQINQNELKFIERNFEGNLDSFLFFIIPRIAKLNLKHLDKIIIENIATENSFENDKDYINILEFNISNIQIELNNIAEEFLKKNLTNQEKFEIQEQNCTEFKNEVENKISKIIDVVNKFKDHIDEKLRSKEEETEIKLSQINDLLNKNTQNLNDGINNIQEHSNSALSDLNMTFQNYKNDINDKILKQENFTKNSIQVLEKRFSKILEIMKGT